jgi:hypothetical protein
MSTVKKRQRVVVGYLSVALAATVALVLSVSSGADGAGAGCTPVHDAGHPVCGSRRGGAQSHGTFQTVRRTASNWDGAMTSGTLGPVPRDVRAGLGTKFNPAPHAHPKVHKRAAVRDALSTAPWPGCATGISLVRTEPTHRKPRGSLVWLVSIHPNSRLGPIGGPHGARDSGHRLTANFAAVVVDAGDGRFVESEDGYTKQLPPWRPSPPRGCQTR